MEQMVYFIYIDIINKKFQIYDGSEVKNINGLRFLDYVNLSKKTICFVDSCKKASQIYVGGTTEAICKRMTGSDYSIYKYGNVEFRSFGAIFAMQDIRCLYDMYGKDHVTVLMEKYISSFGDPTKVKYTLAHNAKKMFYEPIKDHLWEVKKEKKQWYYDFDTYKDMMASNKSGVLTMVYSKYYEDILMFDKRSAYPSVMVNDPLFPIGKIVRVGGSDREYKIHKVLEYLLKKQWFKVVFNGKINGLSDHWYDSKADKTSLEIYNIFTAKLMGKWNDVINALNKYDFTLYKTQETGYLDKEFRDRVIYIYNMKSQYKRETFERFIEKTKLDMLYGKGIEDHFFEDIYDVQKYQKRTRGNSYMTPEMSCHCCAAVEFEMYLTMTNTEFVYADTDGIKVTNDKKHIEYFNKMNEIILHKNKLAGYDSDIGTWENEGIAKRLFIFAPKQYVYDDGEQIVKKIAGMQKTILDMLSSGIKGDFIDYIRHNGFPWICCKYEIDGGEVKTRFEHGKLHGDLESKIA